MLAWQSKAKPSQAMSELQIKIPITTTPTTTTNQNMMIHFGKPQKLQVHGLLANNIIILSSSCINSKSSQK
jgi:hypothetical protein